MDKVPPLRHGTAPLSSRSGSSASATPRTGGGTARSSDGRGTPRDAERLPLNALRSTPPSGVQSADPGMFQRPAVSPLTTSRSGAVSSTPSSDAEGLSSRSGMAADSSWGYHDGAAQQHVVYASEVHRPAWCDDLSREIEVMRHVIIKESARLKEQLQGLDKATGELRGHVVPRPGASSSPPRSLEASSYTAGTCPKRRRAVEWCVRGMDGPRAASLGQGDKSTFTLPEYPGATFAFAFGAKGNAAESNGTWPCRLSFRAHGPGVAATCLSVALEVADVSGGEVRVLGQTYSPVLLRNGGRVACDCSWPSGASCTVACRARLELIGHCAPSSEDDGPVLIQLR